MIKRIIRTGMMFTEVRRFIKTSVSFMVVGVLSGLIMSVFTNLIGTGFSSELISAHTHVILVGSVIMMIMGVSLWIFPRQLQDDKRYNPNLIIMSYWMVTAATAVRFFSQLVISFVEITEIRWFISVTSVFQTIGIVLYFYTIWGRIRPVGSHWREEDGERF
jgi:cbb3-type cytochrome oxidase subunit 1